MVLAHNWAHGYMISPAAFLQSRLSEMESANVTLIVVSCCEKIRESKPGEAFVHVEFLGFKNYVMEVALFTLREVGWSVRWDTSKGEFVIAIPEMMYDNK